MILKVFKNMLYSLIGTFADLPAGVLSFSLSIEFFETGILGNSLGYHKFLQRNIISIFKNAKEAIL